MIKQPHRKLDLRRETIATLNDDKLDTVQGGATPSVAISVATIGVASQIACSWVQRKLTLDK